LNIPLGDLEVTKFNDGEVNVEVTSYFLSLLLLTRLKSQWEGRMFI